jgi:hypothetical protein
VVVVAIVCLFVDIEEMVDGEGRFGRACQCPRERLRWEGGSGATAKEVRSL